MTDKASNTLPLSRVKTIMKSSPEVSSISQEALHLTGKATELFIQALAKYSYQQSDDKKQLHYKDLAHIVNSEDTLQFLHVIESSPGGHYLLDGWRALLADTLPLDYGIPLYQWKEHGMSQDIVPHKVKAKDYIKMLKAKDDNS